MNLEAGVSEVSTPLALLPQAGKCLLLELSHSSRVYTALLIPNQKTSDKGKHQFFVGCNPLYDTAPTSVSFIGNLLLPSHRLIVKVLPQ
jgi:hypothetical protein